MRLPAVTPRGAPRLLAFVLAFSLAAAACGGGGVETVEAGDSGAQTDATAAETSTTSSADVDGVSADENGASADEGEVAPIENLFPDVDVVNVTDGASVNLAAELGGGDTPVLLWFWAPH